MKFVTTGRPFITAKFAMSLDGKIATHTGDSKWITGDKARWHVHKMRASTDAIMVGNRHCLGRRSPTHRP